MNVRKDFLLTVLRLELSVRLTTLKLHLGPGIMSTLTVMLVSIGKWLRLLIYIIQLINLVSSC